MPKLQTFRVLGHMVANTVMTVVMANMFTIGWEQDRKKRDNPVPCVPFWPSDLIPSLNNCKKHLQISDFFSVNAPFYEFHNCQVRT